jgi:hypothetical protein
VRCATCRVEFDNNRSWERIDQGSDMPDGRTTHDLDFCSLACVWTRYPGEAVRHDG